MKIKYVFPLLVAVMLLIVSCEKDDNPDANVTLFGGAKNGVMIATDNASAGAITATLNGLVPESMPDGTSFYFRYSSTSTTQDQLIASSYVIKATKDGNRIYANVSDLKYNTTYYYIAFYCYEGVDCYADEVQSFKTQLSAGPTVDMGLSVKWASCNIGASKPLDNGGYYQWAGTNDVTNLKSELNWTNCPYHTGKDYHTGWSKYVPSSYASYWSGKGNPDNKTVLELSDDIANKNLGGKWRFPTMVEWRELHDNSEITWTTLDNVLGCVITSKKKGYENACIFLPACGFKMGKQIGNVGISGYYWSSDLHEYPQAAQIASINYMGLSVYSTSNRCHGCCVRPVQK